MRETKSIEYIRDEMLKIEKKHDLLNLKIKDVKIWQSVRVFLYYKIAQETGSFGVMHTVKDSIFDRIKNLHSFIKSCLFYNPLLSRMQRDIIIYDHQRKIKYNVITLLYDF